MAAKLGQLWTRLPHQGEVKWERTARHTLDLHKAFVDTFLDDVPAKFSLMRVTKETQWKRWAETEEERFFKTYYVFLKNNVGPFSRYHVCVDQKSFRKDYRWARLHYLINKSRRTDWGLTRRNIRKFEVVDSKASFLMQLTDILLGSLTSDAGAGPKSELRQHVLERNTAAALRKVRTCMFTPEGRVRSTEPSVFSATR